MSTAQGIGSIQNVGTTVPKKQEGFWGDDGFTFGDLVDLVNPLQHIPVVSTIYRAVTGDTQSTGAKVIGGGIFGGVIGLVASFVDASMTEGGGKNIGEQIVAAFTPEPAETDVMLAQATPAASAPLEIATLEAPLLTKLPAPQGIPEATPYFAASAVPEQAIVAEPPITHFAKPDVTTLPATLPGRAGTNHKAEVQAAIQKYLEATAELEEDAAQDRYSAIAADMLL